jgi:peptidoglycan/LPS O-acetylase OafA/YrhL
MPWASGGFLGVDAFFVLSGYLITTLLLTEWQRDRRIDVVAFWGRRARRLLPALLVTVAAVVVTASALLPEDEQGPLRSDAWATLLYFNNWNMMAGGEDYFAVTADPSWLEHTWSLAIEEQFYFLWPLLTPGSAPMATCATQTSSGVPRRGGRVGRCACPVARSH